MLEYKLGYFATSLCGHDKGRIYMIVKMEGEMIGFLRRMPIRESVMRLLEWKGVK